MVERYSQTFKGAESGNELLTREIVASRPLTTEALEHLAAGVVGTTLVASQGTEPSDVLEHSKTEIISEGTS